MADKKEAKKEKKPKKDIFEQFQTDHRPTREQLLTYFPVALAMTSLPLYLYVTIFGLDLQSNLPLFGVVSILSAMIMTLAYHNVAYWLRLRLTPGREGTKKDPKQSEATNKETMLFSILYNNALFLFILVLLGFFVFRTDSAAYNYVLSVSLSSGALSFFVAAAL